LLGIEGIEDRTEDLEEQETKILLKKRPGEVSQPFAALLPDSFWRIFLWRKKAKQKAKKPPKTPVSVGSRDHEGADQKQEGLNSVKEKQIFRNQDKPIYGWPSGWEYRA
jgi:hypothetical protein